MAFLPPISSWTLPSRSARPTAMPRPTSLEPVNERASTAGESTSAAPTVRPEPITRLNTPSGRPARERISVSSQADAGTISAGLKTTALPNASAGAIFHAGMAIG